MPCQQWNCWQTTNPWQQFSVQTWLPRPTISVAYNLLITDHTPGLQSTLPVHKDSRLTGSWGSICSVFFTVVTGLFIMACCHSGISSLFLFWFLPCVCCLLITWSLPHIRFVCSFQSNTVVPVIACVFAVVTIKCVKHLVMSKQDNLIATGCKIGHVSLEAFVLPLPIIVESLWPWLLTKCTRLAKLRRM